MQVILKKNGKELTVIPDDKIDSSNAQDFRKTVEDHLDGISTINFDLSKIDYISSMGIVVMLSIKKKLGQYGNMNIMNASGVVREVFEISGFEELLVN